MRDSFSDRFCDDLCEVIVSYLSFEDKIRFECVSKQWQNCIYIKQNTIEINRFLIKNKNTLNSLLMRNKNYRTYCESIKFCTLMYFGP